MLHVKQLEVGDNFQKQRCYLKMAKVEITQICDGHMYLHKMEGLIQA